MIEFFLFFNVASLLGVWLGITLLTFKRSKKNGLLCLFFPPYAFVSGWQVSKPLFLALIITSVGFAGTVDNLSEFLSRPKYQGEVIKQSEYARVRLDMSNLSKYSGSDVDQLFLKLGAQETWKVKTFLGRRMAIRGNIGRKPGFFGNGFFPVQPGDQINRYRVLVTEKMIHGYSTFKSHWTDLKEEMKSVEHNLTVAEIKLGMDQWRSHLIVPIGEGLFLEITEEAKGKPRKMTQKILDEIIPEIHSLHAPSQR